MTYEHYIGVKPREGFWEPGDWYEDEAEQPCIVLIAFTSEQERDEEAAYWNEPPMEWEYVPLDREKAFTAQEAGGAWTPCEPEGAWTRGEYECKVIIVN